MSSVGVGNSLVRTGLDAQGIPVKGLHKLPLKNENHLFASQGCPIPLAAPLLATQGVCSNGEEDQVHNIYRRLGNFRVKNILCVNFSWR